MKRTTSARKHRDAPAIIDEALLRKWPLPPLQAHAGKEGRGRILIVGGSEQTPGGILLAAQAALRVGAGKLLLGTSRGIAPSVAVAMPEARVIGLPQSDSGELAAGACADLLDEALRHHALLIGPGMFDGVAGVELARACLAAEGGPTLVLDAAPLAGMQSLCEGEPLGTPAEPRLVLTPHAGEMSRLCGIDRDQIVAQPLPIARQIARRTGAVVALKNAVTYVVAPDGRAFENTAGNIGLGTSGSGDVLAGTIAGLCARGADPLQAAVWGVHLHACAGDALARKLGGLGFLAREIADEVPALLSTFCRQTRRKSVRSSKRR